MLLIHMHFPLPLTALKMKNHVRIQIEHHQSKYHILNRPTNFPTLSLSHASILTVTHRRNQTFLAPQSPPHINNSIGDRKIHTQQHH